MKKNALRFLKTVIGAGLICCFAAYAFQVIANANAETNAENAVRMPAIMYHSICETNNNDYVLSPALLEQDLSYLQTHGYTAVSTQDLLQSYQGKPLPQKPVLITFDDGFYNNYRFLPSLMEKYDMKCIISVVGAFCDKENGQKQSLSYSYLNWHQVKELSQNPRFEIQNHSYDMHKLKGRQGVKKRSDESPQAYRSALMDDVGKNQKKITDLGIPTPLTFTYPYGLASKETPAILKEMGFKVFLSCAEGINYLKNEKSLQYIKRYNRPAKYTTQQFFEKFIEAD